MFTVYVLYNPINKKIYIGQTSNLDHRLHQHNDDSIRSVKSYTHKHKASGYWQCIYKQEYNTRSEAIKREKQLKTSRGRDFIKYQLK